MSKASTLFTREEIRQFTALSDLQGATSVLADWGLIGFALAAAAWWPHPVTVVLAVILIGGRQLGLAILSHEAAHRTLFRTRWLNDAVGKWLCGAPIWLDVRRYRIQHLQHHIHTGQPDDPDLGLVEPYPTTRAGLARKLLRDVAGLTGLKRLAGLLAMDLGFVSYTMSTGAEPLPPISWSERLRIGLPRLMPVLLTNLALLVLLASLGYPWLYLLWIVAYLTSYSVVMRIRAIAEHAAMPRTADQLRNTRTTHASWLTRLVLAPHHVNYHLEHHLLMMAPHWRLPQIHAHLHKVGALDAHNTAPSYVAVLKHATA